MKAVPRSSLPSVNAAASLTPGQSSPAAHAPSGDRGPAKYPRWTRLVFYLVALYAAIPIVDFPAFGLSLSAPMFFLVAIPAVLRPPKSWWQANRRWITLAALTWTGIFISTIANGLLSGGANISRAGLSTVLHYAYWLLLFVVTVHFAAQEGVAARTATVMGWGAFLIAAARWWEVLRYGNIGAWTGTHLLLQNDYGFLFSTLSPFLLMGLVRARGLWKLPVGMANLALWGAAAINGSRGSWVAIGIGLLLTLVLLSMSRPRLAAGFLTGALLAGGAAALLFLNVPALLGPVLERANSFQTLSTDKSYQIRLLMNQKSERLFAASPIIGIGAARYNLETIQLELPLALSYASQSHFETKSAHNAYLGFLAENGLVGALPFAVLLATLVIGGFKAQRYFVKRDAFWALAIYMSFIEMSIHMWAIFSIANTIVWFVYGLVGAMIMTWRSSAPS